MPKQLYSTITLRHDTEAKWQKSFYTALEGEVIIYDEDKNHTTPRIKIGNGIDDVNDLPFIVRNSDFIITYNEINHSIDQGGSNIYKEWQSGSNLILKKIYNIEDSEQTGTEFYQYIGENIASNSGALSLRFISFNNIEKTGAIYTGYELYDIHKNYSSSPSVREIKVNYSFLEKINPVGEGTFSLNRDENSDIGEYSFAEGYLTAASGYASHAEGGPMLDDWTEPPTVLPTNIYLPGVPEPEHIYGPKAAGDYSHAEGQASYALGIASHAEGAGQAFGDYSHAETASFAMGNDSHAEGEAFSYGYSSHAENSSTALGEYSHAEGSGGITYSYASHTEGSAYDRWPIDIEISGSNYSYTIHDFESVKNSISLLGNVIYFWSEEDGTEAFALITDVNYDDGTITLDNPIFETPVNNILVTVHSVGATAEGSHKEGMDNLASGWASHAEGLQTIASGYVSHSEGGYTIAKGYYSHAEGEFSYAEGEGSHAEGEYTKATGAKSHAEGVQTKAEGSYSHAEGQWAEAKGASSHAEGGFSYAEGQASHAEGYYTQAIANYSHAEGNRTKASSESQHAQGKYNIVDENNIYAHIVGNGTTEHARSNAHTLDWEGNAWFAGDVYIGSTSGTNKDDGSKKLATEEYINNITPTFTVVGTTLVVGSATTIPAAEDYSF